MKRSIVLGLVALGLGLAWMSSADAGDGCKCCVDKAKAGTGFCCGSGLVFGVQTKSKALYEAMAGKKVDTATWPCGDCKKALAAGGECASCKVYAADGQLYRSPVAASLAKGNLVPEGSSATECSACKDALKDNGFCDKCGVGFVANRVYASKDDWKAAQKAHTTLTSAAAASAKCDTCAVAMVTDGSCGPCNVSFKDGKMASRTP